MEAVLRARRAGISREWTSRGPRTPPEEEIRHLKRENDLLRQKREQTKKSYRSLFARPPVKFQVTAEQPNTWWVTDTKAVETAERWLYLAVILHLCLRMSVSVQAGWLRNIVVRQGR